MEDLVASGMVSRPMRFRLLAACLVMGELGLRFFERLAGLEVNYRSEMGSVGNVRWEDGLFCKCFSKSRRERVWG
jgi:hypothetical protein